MSKKNIMNLMVDIFYMNEEIMYSIIFSSNSKLSKSFKKNVSKILNLQITNKATTFKKKMFHLF
uniref:Uncharacterized protein n=1 Tax=viral metagenome TaxID=1070528 RepID=A0A6C0LSB6_9ZZZZ